MKHRFSCRTCCWWEGAVVAIGGTVMRECQHPEIGKPGNKMSSGRNVVDSHDSGGVLTGPDFGCIHHDGDSVNEPVDYSI